jgi:cobyrinic acid a,c-diamide synthase
MRDSALPPGIGGLILGGGYPEEHAAALAANPGMRAAVRAVADRGLAVYAECGGLMYLGQTLETRAGEVQPMCGVLPLRTRLLPRLKTLGYVEVETTATGPLGPAGTRLRGHEFHYSEIAELLPGAESWLPAFRASRRREAESQPAGFRRGSVVASYVHLHLGSQPAAATAFVDACRQAATERSAG